MSFWEYKVISSGKGGFATPALLEKFLNDLGRDSWEIIEFRSASDNALAFSGLARRSTQRDWTLEDAAAAAAKAEAEKLRAEFEAKFKAATTPGGSAEERVPSFLEEKVAGDDGFRKLVDTSHDDEPEPAEDEKDDWDKLTAAEEDDLPTFFDAIKPHMRRNQRGPGMSVGVDFLAKKWDQSEDDINGALTECGFVVPEDEDAKVEYLEYDGDLYWLNVNRRGELWINTKEKPRPVFKAVKAQRVAVEDEPKQDNQNQNQNRNQRDRGDRNQDGRKQQQENRQQQPKPEDAATAPEGAAPESAVAATDTPPQEGKPQGQPGNSESAKGQGGGSGAPLPQGADLLQKIRPHMRRNRRGPGGSGSTTFLARALRTNEGDLKAAFVALGLTLPAHPNDKPVYAEVGGDLWWLNVDSRGGLWINGREKRQGETAGSAKEESNGPQGGASAEGTAPAAGTAPTEGAASAEERSSSENKPAEGTAPVEGETAGSTPKAAPAGSGSTENFAPVSVLAANAAAPEVSHTEPPKSAAVVPNDPNPPAVPASEAAPMPASVSSGAGAGPLNPIRALLKESKGGVSGKIDAIAQELGQPADALVATLVGAGLKVPEKPREKPVTIEHGGESLWFSVNAKGELFLNAKSAKDSAEGGDKPKRPKSRSKKSDETVEQPAE